MIRSALKNSTVNMNTTDGPVMASTSMLSPPTSTAASPPQNSNKRHITWDVNRENHEEGSEGSSVIERPRKALKSSCPTVPTYQIERHESSLDLSSIFDKPANGAEAQRTNNNNNNNNNNTAGGWGGLSFIKNATRRLLARSEPGIISQTNVNKPIAMQTTPLGPPLQLEPIVLDHNTTKNNGRPNDGKNSRIPRTKSSTDGFGLY